MAERMWSGRFRHGAIATVVVALAGLAACTPPEPSTPSPYACDGSNAVPLGPGHMVAGMSDDGRHVVVTEFVGDGNTVSHLIDRRTGTRVLLDDTPGFSDGIGVVFSSDGQQLAYTGWAGTATDDSWRIYDIASGTKRNLRPEPFLPPDYVTDISTDLARIRIEPWSWPTPPGPARLVELATGDDTTLPGVTVGYLDDVSPSLARAVHMTRADAAEDMTASIVDVRTGAVVRVIGPLRSRSGFNAGSIRFLDEDVVLVDDAVPAGSPDDGIPSDGAFVLDLTSGVVTRIDPGIVGARALAATTDGARSLHATADGIRLRTTGAAPVLVAPQRFAPVGVDRALRTIAWSDDGIAYVRCI